MKTKLSNAKRFVQNNKTAIAAMAGAALGVSATYYALYANRTLLEINESHNHHMRDNNVAMVYETSFGDFLLTAIPTQD